MFLLAGAADPPPGIGAQDEAVYSHAAIGMAERGDWLTPRFLGRFFLYKPPLVYWLSAASAKLLGVSAWALRLPSVLASALTVGIVFVWVCSAAGWLRALAAVVLVGASALFVDLSRRNMTDAVVTLTIVAAAWMLARGGPSWVLAICVAAGVLSKSIAGLIPLLIASVWWLAAPVRPRLARLAVAAGLGLLAAAPWFVYQFVVHRQWFLGEFLGVELLAYGASRPPQPGSGGALGFYLPRLAIDSPVLVLLVGFSLGAIVKALRTERTPRLTALLSALAVMMAALLAYQYHNVTYLMPLIPLLAIAAAEYAPAWGLIALAAIPVLFLVRGDSGPRIPTAVLLAEQYCDMQRGNELIVVGAGDEFSISTLPLAGLRYAIPAARRHEGQVTLDFASMGIVLPVAEFNQLAAARLRYAPRLRGWGLPDDAALGSVIDWGSAEELTELVAGNPDRDFLFEDGIPAPASPHRHLRAGGAMLLLAGRALRRGPSQRACRL